MTTAIEPDGFERDYPVLAYLSRYGVGHVQDLRDILEEAAAFRRHHIDPVALDVDRQAMADPCYVSDGVLEAAARQGWLTTMIPRLLGGRGLPLGATMMALEELSVGCLGLANLIAAHGLALCTIAGTGDVQRMAEVCRELVLSSANGRPALLSTALTEPSAGTDYEDEDLLRLARLSSEARPAPGGYILGGRKVFISNGSIAETHVVIMPTDRKRPVESLAAFLVRRGTPGLSVGRVERKMGQKACPAAELVFEDCFVPEDRRLVGAPVMRALDLALGATRGAVGVFGAGVARAAFERALAYARTHEHEGRPLIEQQWAQFRLTEMRRNLMVARAAYVEAMLSNELFGLASLLRPNALERAARLLPDAVIDRLPVERVVGSRLVGEAFARAIAHMSEAMIGVSSALGAHGKVTGTDMGMRNCELALDLMGEDGLRHDRGVEKLFRDARLLQIYEGTNQLNRMEVHKRLIAGGVQRV